MSRRNPELVLCCTSVALIPSGFRPRVAPCECCIMNMTTPLTSQLESARADQVERWRNGDRRPVEDYLRECESLGGDEEAVLELIYSEVVVREEVGEAPRLEEYL